MKEFKTFQKLQEEPSKNGKLSILKAEETQTLKQMLLYTYDRFRTYRIKQIDFPNHYNEVQPDISVQLFALLDLLAQHETGSTEAKALIKNLLAKCTEANAKWVARIITRDLKVGVDESTINKAFSELTPVFNCQLAHPVYSKKTGKDYWPTIKYPVIAEPKLDGMRVIAVCKSGKVTFYSREGHELDECGVIARQILMMMPGKDYVLDGECIAKAFSPDNKVALKYKDSSWEYDSGKSMLKKPVKEEIRNYLGYYVWDVIDLEYFESQGKKGVAKTLRERKADLFAYFERRTAEWSNLFMVENVVCTDRKQITDYFNLLRSRNEEHVAVDKNGKEVSYKLGAHEGVMIKDLNKPYEFKRSAAVLKMKEFFTCDLRITGAYEGTKGSKLEGTLGGIILVSDCGTVNTDCGSGFSESLRDELWLRYVEGTLIDSICEISFQELTGDGSLRFPVFIRMRPDKSSTSVEG